MRWGSEQKKNVVLAKRGLLAGYCYAVSLELLVVLIALILQGPSMERNALLGGYSFARLVLCGIVISGSLLSGFLGWSVARTPRVPSRLFSNPEMSSALRDLLTLGALGICSLIFMRSYSPEFLGFIWPPFSAVIDRSFPMVIFLAIFFLQSLFVVSWLECDDHNRVVKPVIQRLLPVILAIALFGLSLGVFQGSTNLIDNQHTNIGYFPDLAEAFLDKKLYLENPLNTKDLSLYAGKYFVSFPPLATLLMLPTVAQYTKYGVDTIHFGNYSAALGVTLTYLGVYALSKRKWVQLKLHEVALIAISIGLGTPLFYMATTGAIWHVSQILTFLFLGLAIWIALCNRSGLMWNNFRTALLAGLALALAMLARPHVVLAGFLIAGVGYQNFRRERCLFLESISAVAWNSRCSYNPGDPWPALVQHGTVRFSL
ncbi:MAG: hypothetical protein KJZ53_05945 [Anaerolineales bacterium]|nr:hypothetical protein [Anaerolineales bacterium]